MPDSTAQSSPAELAVWLEWASAKLIAMPGRRIGPTDSRVLWPDYAQHLFEVTDFRRGPSIRAQAPSSTEIALMDEILLLPNLLDQQLPRQIIRVRSLVHPINHRYLYSWSQVAKVVAVKVHNARYIYQKGLRQLTVEVDGSKAHTIRAKYQTLAISH